MRGPTRGLFDHCHGPIVSESFLVLTLIKSSVFQMNVFEDERVRGRGGDKVKLGFGPFVRQETSAADEDSFAITNPPQDGRGGFGGNGGS